MVEPWCRGWKHRAHFWSLKSLASRTRSLLDAFLFLPAIPRLLPRCPCPVLCAMQVRGSRIAQAGLARRNSGTPSTIHPRCKSVVSGGAAWESIAGLIQRSQGRGYPTEKPEGPKRGKALLWLETDQRHRCQRHSSARRFFVLSRLWHWRMCASS
jgi:hypothetical protein